MSKQTDDLIVQLEREINATPTGHSREVLTSINILLQTYKNKDVLLTEAEKKIAEINTLTLSTLKYKKIVNSINMLCREYFRMRANKTV